MSRPPPRTPAEKNKKIVTMEAKTPTKQPKSGPQRINRCNSDHHHPVVPPALVPGACGKELRILAESKRRELGPADALHYIRARCAASIRAADHRNEQSLTCLYISFEDLREYVPYEARCDADPLAQTLNKQLGLRVAAHTECTCKWENYHCSCGDTGLLFDWSQS